VPGRDVSQALTGATPSSVRRVVPWGLGILAVLATGIVIGTRLGSPGSSEDVGTGHAAPSTRVAQALGRHAIPSSAHTRAGAVAAAARSITAFAGHVLLEPARLRTVVAQVAGRASRTRLTRAFEEASAQTRAKLGADSVPRPVIVLRAVPLGYRLEHYSSDWASVAVWYVGIVGSGATVEPQQSWRTQTVSLVWEDGDWKVSSFASSAGPTPALATAEAEPPGELFAAIPSFTPFKHAEP
jgi:hypothetical protein